MNTITFPKTQLSTMLEALRNLDDCPKQNYDIQDFSQEEQVDRTKLTGFAPPRFPGRPSSSPVRNAARCTGSSSNTRSMRKMKITK